MSWVLTITGEDGKGLREQVMELAGDMATFGIQLKGLPKMSATEAAPAVEFRAPSPDSGTHGWKANVSLALAAKAPSIPLESLHPISAPAPVDPPKEKTETRGRKPRSTPVSSKVADIAADMTTENKNSISLMPTGAVAADAAPAGVTAAESKASPTPAVTSGPVKSELIEALSTVCDNVSMDAGREVLARFGVQKTKELKPDQFDAFVAACKQMVAEKKA